MSVQQPAYPTPSRTWKVVAITLGAVMLGGLLFVAGLVAGVAIGSSGSTSGVAPGAGSVDAGTAPSVGSGPLDPCVVGTWRTVEHRESMDTKEQGTVTVTGLTRTLRITAEGTETVTYDSAPATVSTQQGTGSAVFDGTVVYRVGTDGDRMSFALVSAKGSITVTDKDGKKQSQPLKPGTGAVTYSCTATRLTQDATGFHAAYEKVS